MTWFLEIFPAIDATVSIRLTWALVHFVWIGCAWAVLAKIASWLLRRASAQARYVVHVLALLGMLTALPMTFALLPETIARRVAEVATDSLGDNVAPTAKRVPITNPPDPASEVRTGNSDDSLFSRAISSSDERSAETRPADTIRSSQFSEVSFSWSALDTWAPYITTLYLGGVLLMIGKVIVALWSGRRLARATEIVDDQTILAMVMRQSQRLGMRAAPLVGWCHRTTVPVVIGMLRPMILVPATMATGLDAAHIEALLAHELAHIRRFDLWINLLQRLVEALLFFHPAVWYVSRHASIERENACDDLVLTAGWPRMMYVESLLRMAELHLASSSKPWSSSAGLLAASGDTPTQFKRRILRLMGNDPAPRLALKPAGILGLTLALVFAVATPFVVQSWAENKLIEHTVAAHPWTENHSGENAESAELRSADDAAKAPRNALNETPLAAIDFTNPRKAAKSLAKLLIAGKYADVSGHFAPELAAELSADQLAEVWNRVVKAAGESPQHRYDELPRLGDRIVYEQRFRAENADFLLGFVFDESGKIVGLRWRAGDRGAIAETALPKEGLQFGPSLRRLAGATGSITVITQDTVGAKVNSARPSLWREVPIATAPADAWKPADGTAWVNLDGLSADKVARFENLVAGRYRVSSSFPQPDGNRQGFSDPVELLSDQAQVEVTVGIREGGRFEFRLVHETDRTPIADGWCHVTRVEHDWPESDFPAKYNRDSNTWFVGGLPPGRYLVTAGRRAATPEDSVFELPDGKVELATPGMGTTFKQELSLRGRPLTENELRQRWPWIVEGTVRNVNGKPIPGVEMTASAGWGTLRVTGSTRTDADGRYRLRFGRGMMVFHEEPDPLDIQAAIIHARLPGHAEKTLGRQADLLAANRMPRPDELKNWGNDFYNVDKLIIEGTPRHIDFVMAPAADWKVCVLDHQAQPLKGWHISIKGSILPPGASVIESHTTDEQGCATFTDIPCDYDWRIVIEHRESKESDISPLVRFKTSGNYETVMQRGTHEPSGLTFLSFKSFRDHQGIDKSSEILVADPRTASPVSPELQQEARELLKRVGEVNRDWLLAPPEAIHKYSFRFLRPGQEPRRIEVSPHERKNWTDTRGTAYVPSVGILAAQADQLIFRQVEHRGGNVYLSYIATPKSSPMRTHYGIGVAGSYGPFVSSSFREGTLKIDERTAAVYEHRTGELSEEFSDYVATREGHIAPTRIKISQRDQLVHDWEFTVHRMGLWLLTRARTGKGEEAARIDEVQIFDPPENR